MIRAAGGVLWRRGDAGTEVAVVHRPKYDDWSLPKGKLDPGELHLPAALREIREETGYDGRAGLGLGETRYTVRDGRGTSPKTVRWWAVEATGGSFTPHAEVDDLRWLGLPEARALLPDSEPLARFAALPLDAAVVLLVRHASAGDASDFDGPDRLRPLDRKGIQQAALLPDVLACYAPHRILSAPAVRCAQTVAPLASRLAIEVEVDPLLGEEGAPAAPEQHVMDLSTPGGAVVLCSQGGVIPRVVAALRGDGAPVAARKGSVWVLGLHARRLVAAEDDVLT